MRMFRTLLLLALVSLHAPSAQADAWARARGEFFFSFSQSMQSGLSAMIAGVFSVDRFNSLYIEYGLGHRLTLGAELGRGEYEDEVMAILRRTLTVVV